MSKKPLPLVYLAELLAETDSTQDSDVTLKLDWAIQFVHDAFKSTEHLLDPQVHIDEDGELAGIAFICNGVLMASITAYNLAAELEVCSHAGIRNAVAGGLSSLQSRLSRVF